MNIVNATAQTPSEVSLKLVLQDGSEYSDIEGNPYKGVQVGEYYWMTNNLNNPVGHHTTSKGDIDWIHQCYVMFDNWRPPQEPGRQDKTYWEMLAAMGVSESQALYDFNKHYGQYYKLRPAVGYVYNGTMKENGTLNTAWGLPESEDLLQLLGMCGSVSSTGEVKTYLSADRHDYSAPAFARINGHNPNQSSPYYWWFDNNQNTYNLNFVPGGSRFDWNSTLTTENYGQFVSFPAPAGSFNGLNQTLKITTKSGTSFTLHDYPEMTYYMAFESFPARFCRKLTDNELGYKLYISINGNANNIPFPETPIYQYDNSGLSIYKSQEEHLLEYIKYGILSPSDVKIIKLNIGQTPQEGYYELPRGYIRGLFVQHILNNASPKTISDIINIAIFNSRLWVIKQNGILTIKAKHSETGEPINGGIYKIKTERGNNLHIDSIYAVSVNGEITVSGLPCPERYSVTEIVPPVGHQATTATLYTETTPYPNNNVREVTFEYGRKVDQIELHYSQSDENNIIQQYEGVKIGEYYWMNSNFYNPLHNSPTRDQLETRINLDGLSPIYYQVDMDDFRRHYGEYYSRYEIEITIGQSGKIYEGSNKKKTSWGYPSVADFEQLFGMCGEGSTPEIIEYLGCSVSDNPVAISFPGMTWFDNNKNIYKFNLMPGGGRNHASSWEGGADRPAGHFYDLLKMARFAAADNQTITIKNGHSRVMGKLWHWLNIRWCRKLTDEELGYKLYINTPYTRPFPYVKPSTTNIIELGLKENIPDGYYELPNGYLRGLYVQHMLGKTSPSYTLTEIVHIANLLEGQTSTSIIQSENNSDLKVFFTSGKEQLIIEYNHAIKKIEVFNMLGQLIYSGAEKSINTSNLNNGTYLVIIQSEKETVAKKVIR